MKRKRCKIENCRGYFYAKGMCRSHYMKQWESNRDSPRENNGKGELMARAIQIVLMFQAGPVTSGMLRDKFKISNQCANRWIQEASRYMPVVDVGMTEGGGRGERCIIYELMK